MRFIFYPISACFLGALLFAGCGKQPDAQKSQPPATTNAAPAAAEVAAPVPVEKVCFECQGEGTVPCLVPGCVNGQVDCPGPCLKLSHGTWIHLNMPGHDTNELWQEFPNLGDRLGYEAWSQKHVGEVIEYRNGVAVNNGKCKICGGTTKVKCDVCKGTGKVTCPVCSGKKSVPAAWTPTDNPWFNRQPDAIRLADGQALLGRVTAEAGEDRTIETRDKKILHVKASDILPKTDANAPAAPASPAK